MHFVPTKPDGSINVDIVEAVIRRHHDALCELHANLRRLGATPMLLELLDSAADTLDHAITEAKQLYD